MISLAASKEIAVNVSEVVRKEEPHRQMAGKYLVLGFYEVTFLVHCWKGP